MGWYQYSKQLWWCQASSASCSGVGTRAYRYLCGRSCLQLPYRDFILPCYLGSCVLPASCWCNIFAGHLEQAELLPGLVCSGVRHAWQCSPGHSARVTEHFFLPSLVQHTMSLWGLRILPYFGWESKLCLSLLHCGVDKVNSRVGMPTSCAKTGIPTLLLTLSTPQWGRSCFRVLTLPILPTHSTASLLKV